MRLADGLLPGEDPVARSSAEARRWLEAYDQLLQDTHADGADGPVSGPLLEARRRHYRTRISFWRRRLDELARREKHPAEPRPGMVRLSDVPEDLKFSGEPLTGLLDGDPILITAVLERTAVVMSPDDVWGRERRLEPRESILVPAEALKTHFRLAPVVVPSIRGNGRRQPR